MLDEETAPILEPPSSPEARFRAGSATMLRQSRRLLWRSRGLVYTALASFTACWLLLSASSGNYSVVPWTVDMSGTAMGYGGGGFRTGSRGKAKSKDYDDKVNQWLFSKEYNETGLYVVVGHRSKLCDDGLGRLMALADYPAQARYMGTLFPPWLARTRSDQRRIQN